ncbi:MAG TPA: GNAT family N-acetyltransferase [Porticoccus sp.]|nr:GNAT family N-acetyltransferase [Porticoccus sp.]
MYHYREMCLADIPAAFHVRTSTIENPLTLQELEQDYELTPESLAQAMKASSKGWVCEDDNQVVGFAMGDPYEGELTVLAVLPKHEGNGIGKRLLATVESWLLESGCDELWLLTTPDPTLRAYKLYLSKGWTATGEIIDEDEKFVKVCS